MGSGSGIADTADQLAPRGRHRGAAEGTPAGPPGRGAPSHARPTVGPTTPPPVDPLVDSTPGGLRAFNLGTIPASVTPPRTWRRAALFAVFASAAALAGLVLVTAVLVVPVRPASRMDALPNFPRGVPLATVAEPAPSRPAAHRPAAAPDPASQPDRAATVLADAGAVAALPTGGAPAGPGTSASGSAVATPVPTGSGAPAGPPQGGGTTVTTVTSGPPVVDPGTLVNRTQTFFAEVTSDARAAVDLTAQTVKDDALAAINHRYGDVSAIEVRSISLDPSSGVTVNLLRIVRKDGTTSTDQTTLQFTLTGDPKILNPGG